MKTQIGLGILSIPGAFNTLGMIPGIICLLSVGVMITWSMYMIGVFKIRHRGIYGIDDVGGLMFGCVGREVFALGFTLRKWPSGQPLWNTFRCILTAPCFQN